MLGLLGDISMKYLTLYFAPEECYAVVKSNCALIKTASDDEVTVKSGGAYHSGTIIGKSGTFNFQLIKFWFNEVSQKK